MTPAVSVIIGLYNKRPYIARAVESVLGQSLRDFEIVVVDDGSTDGGAAELDRYRGDPRVRIVRQPNAGEGAARNRGLREMRSDLAAFLDADDAFLPNHLESLAALARRYPAAGLLATAYYDALPDGTRIARTIGGEGSRVLGDGCDDYFAASCRHGFIVQVAGACVRRSIADRTGGFLEGVRIGADLEFWARVALQCPVAYDPCPSALYYRWTPGGVMAAYQWRPDIPVVVEMLYREIEKRYGVSNSLSSAAADYASWILLKHAASGIVAGQRRAAKRVLRHPVFARSRLRRQRALVWAAATCAPDAALRAYLGLRNWQVRLWQTVAAGRNRASAADPKGSALPLY